MTKNSLFLSIAFMGTLCNSTIFSSEKAIPTFHETKLEELKLKLKSIENCMSWNIYLAILLSAIVIDSCTSTLHYTHNDRQDRVFPPKDAIFLTTLAALNIYSLNKRINEKYNIAKKIKKLKIFLYAQTTKKTQESSCS